MIEHTISGELYDELRDGTALDDGTGEHVRWGYGITRAADIEVHAMVHAAIGRKRGFGHSYTMVGSREAWAAIGKYASDQGYIESNGAGDFDRGKGARLQAQADRIDALLGRHSTTTRTREDDDA